MGITDNYLYCQGFVYIAGRNRRCNWMGKPYELQGGRCPRCGGRVVGE
jgi:hypothetical protein